MKKKNILIIQQILPHYRIKFFFRLSKLCNLSLSFNQINLKEGFIQTYLNKSINFVTTKKINFFYLYYQTNLLKNIFLKRYEKVILSCDVKNITNFFILLLCKILNIKCYVWGHGYFGKNNKYKYFIYKVYYIIINKLAYKYIAYNKQSKKSLYGLISKKKIIFVNNTLEKKFKKIKKNFNEKNIIFIGRLRDRCNLEILIRSMAKINSINKEISLKVIGNGKLFNYYKKKANKLKVNIRFYKEKINFEKISKNCFLGVYPGDVGLTVVDYMLLNLPILIHDRLNEHMGPEAYYVKNNYNGLLFKKNSVDDLTNKILKIYKDKTLRKKISKNTIYMIQRLNKSEYSKIFFNKVILN